MKKRILCIILSLCLMASVLPISAAALSSPHLAEWYEEADTDFEDVVNPDRKYNTYALDDEELANMDEAYEYLTREMDLNMAAACGILANMLCESNFHPECESSSGKYFGMIQWDEAALGVKSWISQQGYDPYSVEGQMRFLDYHLQSGGYKCDETYETLTSVPNTAEGAYTAGYRFCYDYERPSNKESKSDTRGNIAAQIMYRVYSQVENEGMPFTDVPVGSWYYPYVKEAYEKNFFTGTSDTTFSPNLNMTRAQAVQVLYSAYLEAGNPRVTEQSSFSDVSPSAWYAEAVSWAQQNGIVSGMGDSSFVPNGELTREQFAVILYSYNSKFGSLESEETVSLSDYPDSDALTWSRTAVEWAVSCGVISGVKDGNQTILAPRQSCTRAQGATIIVGYFD